MKFKPAKLTLENGKEIFLVAKNCANVIHMVVVDKDGNEVDGGIIMQFTSKGYYRTGYIDENIGLPLNSEGKLKKDKEF